VRKQSHILKEAICELVMVNRILGNENARDALGQGLEALSPVPGGVRLAKATAL
jgi:hypothetical protein